MYLSRRTNAVTLINIAKIVSFCGHPLILGIFAALFQSFYLYSWLIAIKIVGIIVLLIILPVTIWNYYMTKKGAYSGFDIPERSQRNSFYVFVCIAFSVAILYMYLTHQSKPLIISLSNCIRMIILSFTVNFFIKTSLHTATSFYLSFLLLRYNLAVGISLLGFAILIGVSRKLLQQHSIKEIISGGLIGILFGTILYYQLVNIS